MAPSQKVYSAEHKDCIPNPDKEPVYILLARLLILTLLSVSLVFLTGCTEMIVLTGEKAYNHLRGDFLDIVPNKLDDVYTASLQATRQMDHYQVVEHQLTAISGTIAAFDDEARKITITLTKTENDQTQIQIRIGVIGDKLKSSHIYDCIQQHLRYPQMAMTPYSRTRKMGLSPF
ncbi:MAG: DUF3568 family protein [Planctomycetes bacterium]|nr:DUF3568 family protein [Planctomycetota bacterium]